MHRILISCPILLMFSLSSVAADNSKPIPETFSHDSSQCTFGTQRLEVQLASENQSPGTVKGYPYVWMKPEGAGQVLAIRPLDEKSGNFLLLEKGSPDSSCDRTLTYRLAKGASAILLKQLARADQPESLAVVAWHPESRKIVSVRRDLGAFVETSTWDKGFKFSQNFRPFQSKTTRVPFIKKEREVSEEQLKIWYVVSLKDGKIVSEFSRKQTYETSPYRKYFLNQKSFETAFEWDAKNSVYNKRWVYVAKANAEGEPDCIQPTSKRSFKREEKFWTCEPTDD